MVVKVDRLETAGDGEPAPEDSAGVRRRVAEARRRLAGEPPEPDRAARQLLAEALKSALLTARGVERVRRVAVTIAALACAERVGDEHVAEAIGLRAEW